MPRRLIEQLDLCFPHLPEALQGLRIAQLSDLHIVRPRRRHAQILHELGGMHVDLIFLTGDYMSHPGDEPAAGKAMQEIAERLQAPLGIFGVFGNHDTPALRQRVADLGVHWLRNECVHPAGLPLEILGIDTDVRRAPDSMGLLAGWARAPDQQAAASRREHEAAHRSPQMEKTLAGAHAGFGSEPSGRGPIDGPIAGGHDPRPVRHATPRPLRLLLSHLPSFLPSAGDMGIDLMFSGHTHGGQCRLPQARALANSCDLPLRLSSGILRHQQTLAIISRGLGEITLPVRFFCPPHLPVVTLHRGPLLGRATGHIEIVRRW